MISGHTEYLKEGYPNILSVPEREEASQSRYEGGRDEKKSRAADFDELEKTREKIKVRDEALREGRFPVSQNEDEKEQITLGDRDVPSESAERDRVVP